MPGDTFPKIWRRLGLMARVLVFGGLLAAVAGCATEQRPAVVAGASAPAVVSSETPAAPLAEESAPVSVANMSAPAPGASVSAPTRDEATPAADLPAPILAAGEGTVWLAPVVHDAFTAYLAAGVDGAFAVSPDGLLYATAGCGEEPVCTPAASLASQTRALGDCRALIADRLGAVADQSAGDAQCRLLAVDETIVWRGVVQTPTAAEIARAARGLVAAPIRITWETLNAVTPVRIWWKLVSFFGRGRIEFDVGATEEVAAGACAGQFSVLGKSWSVTCTNGLSVEGQVKKSAGSLLGTGTDNLGHEIDFRVALDASAKTPPVPAVSIDAG